MTDIEIKRKEIRKACIAARNALTAEERTEKSVAIAEKLVRTPEYQRAKTVMIYKAVKGEVRLEALEKYNEERVGLERPPFSPRTICCQMKPA